MRDRNIDLIDLFEVLVFIVWYRRDICVKFYMFNSFMVYKKFVVKFM